MMKNVLLPIIFFFREWWDIGNFLFFKEVIRELRGWSSICYYWHYFKLRFFYFFQMQTRTLQSIMFFKEVIRELRGWSSIYYYRHYFKLRFFIFSDANDFVTVLT